MTTRLDPAEHAWLVEPATRAVMDALEAAQPASARFVGGCVRNALMGRPVDDIDIACRLTPEAVIAAADAAGLKSVPTGLAHGTVTLVSQGRPYEITTLREDVSTDGRKATVAYTSDWDADSRRRDFRLNAIYVDAEGVLFDPQGGVADAAAGRIRFIGDPVERIREDYLRILRFFRFTAWYGRAPMDTEALAACAAETKGVRRLSVERVWKELKKLLAAPDPTPALHAMAEAGVLEEALPEALALELIGALVALERAEGWAPDPGLRLAALIPRLEMTAMRVRRRLKLSNQAGERVVRWARQTLNPRLLLGRPELDVAQALYPADVQAFTDRARLAWAIDAASAAAGEAARDEPGADPALWQALFSQLAVYERPVFPLRGEDLVQAGVPKGPRLGAALKALEALWVRGGFKADKPALLAALSLVGEGAS